MRLSVYWIGVKKEEGMVFTSIVKLRCRLFGHKWVYSQTPFTGHMKYFRCCNRCGLIAEYREHYPTYGHFGWFQLVQFTKQGGKELFNKLKKEIMHE